jgi:hypothetical protein
MWMLVVLGMLSGETLASSPWTKFCAKHPGSARQCCYVPKDGPIVCRETDRSNSDDQRLQDELLRRAEEARRKLEREGSSKQ